MSKTKIQAVSRRKTPPVVDAKLDAPDKQAGPQAPQPQTAAAVTRTVGLMRTGDGPSPAQARRMGSLQRSVGNARVSRMLAGTPVQAKLKVSKASDPSEKEAEHAAARVTAGRDPEPVARFLAGSETRRQEDEKLQAAPEEEEKPAQAASEEEEPAQAAAEEEEEAQKAAAEEEEPASRLAEGGGEHHQVDHPELEGRVRAPGGGRPLPAGVRSNMEARTGRDFSEVRVHDTAQDRADSKRLKAKAFARGRHVWLGPGQSANDRDLMAHELTHVIQQGAAPRRRPAGRRNDPDKA